MSNFNASVIFTAGGRELFKREYKNVDKAFVVDRVQTSALNAGMRLNGLSSHSIHTKQAFGNDKPVECVLTVDISSDGKSWAKNVATYGEMGEQPQRILVSTLNATMPRGR